MICTMKTKCPFVNNNCMITLINDLISQVMWPVVTNTQDLSKHSNTDPTFRVKFMGTKNSPNHPVLGAGSIYRYSLKNWHCQTKSCTCYITSVKICEDALTFIFSLQETWSRADTPLPMKQIYIANLAIIRIQSFWKGSGAVVRHCVALNGHRSSKF